MISKPQMLNGTPIPYSASVNELRSQLRPAGDRAWAACIALGHKDGPEAFKVLTSLAEDPDWRYRRSAIEALALHPLAKQAANRICVALRDSSPYVVRTACRTAATLRLGDAHDAVIDLLQSTTAATRETAIRALETLWKPSDFSLVFKLHNSDPVESVRRMAGWTLRTNASGKNWRHLFQKWRKDTLHRHRIWACEIAGLFGDSSDKSKLKPLCQDVDGHVRKAAQRALGGGSR